MDPIIPYIGCPVWAHAPWAGRFFTSDARRENYLRQYSAVFNTAEGNATFYGIPKLDTVLRWKEDAMQSFRFCFKFPRIISHGKQLMGAESELDEFFTRLEPLGEKLGPFFLQLPSDFGAERLAVIETFLSRLPRSFRYALEVRHPDFYDGKEKEARFEAMLSQQKVDRVIFDTRGLFASQASDEATLEAKKKKPRVPLRTSATSDQPFVRFVGDPDVDKNDAALKEWAIQVYRWLSEGKRPFFFTHHPDEAFAPQLGRKLQEYLHRLDSRLPKAPLWPCQTSEAQLDLL
jgi:uncharacterized protein YecE (DUF72 family)